MSNTEIVMSILGLLGSIVVAYFAYKRGRHADEDLAESTAIEQVYAGYGGLLQRLQDDNADLRRRLVEEREARIAELNNLKEEVTELKQRLAAADERISLLLRERNSG